MAFKSLAVPVLTTDTDIIECPATMDGAARLAVSNVSGGASSYTIKVRRQATGSSATLASAVPIAANALVQLPAISLEAGDKIIMTAPSNSIIVVGGAFT